MTGHQAPVFRRSPELAVPVPTSTFADGSEKPLFVPLGVFVASRQTFDFILRSAAPEECDDDIWAFVNAFEELPLVENGWNEDAAKINRIGTSDDGRPIWRLERG